LKQHFPAQKKTGLSWRTLSASARSFQRCKLHICSCFRS